MRPCKHQALLVASIPLLPMLDAALSPRPALAQQVVADGITVTASGTIDTGTTAGPAGIALLALNGGVIQSFSPLTVITRGVGANGAQAESGGTINFFSGSTIQTFGLGAIGAEAQSGGVISLPGVTISSVGIGVRALAGTATVTDSVVATTGDGAFGLFSFISGATLTANNATVTTTGSFAHGASAQAGSTLSFTNGSITTTGADAYGFFVSDGSSILVSGTPIMTSGAWRIRHGGPVRQHRNHHRRLHDDHWC
jgi:hypothetical protein